MSKVGELHTALLKQRRSRTGGLLCIDFGTAFCKAAVSLGDGRSEAIPLGQLAKDPVANNRYVAQSSLYIAPDHTLYFGHGAVHAASQQEQWQVLRIESMKRWLNVGSRGELDDDVANDCLPGGAKLAKREALLLLLAYVTDLACAGLEKLDLSRYIRRRFSRPVFLDDARAHWIDEEMKSLMTRAQLVADTLTGRWSKGIPLDLAKQITAEALSLQIPEWLVEERAVLEPIAAGHAAMSRDFDHRSFSLVVDVGAGTTDFAGFLALQPFGASAVTRTLPQGVPRSITMAGDYLDDVLIEEVLSRVPKSRKSPTVEREATSQARLWKENLFNTGMVAPTFQGGISVEPVTKDDFGLLTGARSFERELRASSEAMLDSAGRLVDHLTTGVRGKITEIGLIATGGGADLPMVRVLAGRTVKFGNTRLPIALIGSANRGRTAKDREDAANFTRLAVAIGGCSPDYPQDRAPEQHVFHRGKI